MKLPFLVQLLLMGWNHWIGYQPSKVVYTHVYVYICIYIMGFFLVMYILNKISVK